MTAFNAFADDDEEVSGIIRDRNGRPYILANPDWTPEECKARGFKNRKAEPRGLSKTYTRVTTFVGALEDTYNLGLWQLRMNTLGLASRPDLVARAQSIDVPRPGEYVTDERSALIKAQLQEISDEALNAAGWKVSAGLGTAFHDVSEVFDKTGKPPRFASPETREALDAYIRVTDGWEYDEDFGIEHFLVNDDLETGGTADRLRKLVKLRKVGSGKLRVTDIKTGSIEFGQGKMALQLADYATSRAYDPETGIRTDLDIDQEFAEIVHVPQGMGVAHVYRVNIAPAVETLELCAKVRAWRARNDLFTAVDSAAGMIDATNDVFSPTAAAWPTTPPKKI